MKLVEKCCRELCKAKEIDPDALVSPFMPTYLNSLPLVNGFYVPPKETTCKAWKLFEHYVTIIFNVIDFDQEEYEN